MPTALGLHSPKLALVRALRTADGRREQRAFAVEGTTMLAEASAAGRAPKAVYITEDAVGQAASLSALPDERVFVVPARAMARLSDLDSPPGILAVFPLALGTVERMLGTGRPVLLLAGIADPGNAGTLVRTAEIFGIRDVLFGRGGVDPYHPKVVRATMGAIFRTDIAVCGAEDVTRLAHIFGYTLVAAQRGGTPLAELDFPDKPIITIGSERHGVTSWIPRSDVSVSIPHIGAGESLNAAVAGGIILYAFVQQRSRLET